MGGEVRTTRYRSSDNRTHKLQRRDRLLLARRAQICFLREREKVPGWLCCSVVELLLLMEEAEAEAEAERAGSGND